MNRNDEAITVFTALGHATLHTYELSIPIFVVVWLQTFDVSAALLGLVVGAGYALLGLGAVPSGILSDRYGSKRLVIVSILGMGGGFLAVSIAPNILVLTLALLLWGAAASIYHPAGLSLLTRGAHERGTALGYHGAAGNIGTAIGPLVATVLLTVLNWRVVAALFVLPAVLGALVAARVDFDENAAVRTVDESTTAPDGGGRERDIRSVSALLTRSRALFTGGFVLVILIEIFYGLYYRGTLTFLPEILGDFSAFTSVSAFGVAIKPGQYIYVSVLLVGVIGQYLGGKLSDRTKPEYLLGGGFGALLVASLVFVPAANTGLFVLLGVCGVIGFCIYGVVPVLQTTVAQYAPTDAYGLSFGYVYAAAFGIGALGAAAAGVILTYTTVSVLFVLLAGCAAANGLLSVRLLSYSSSMEKADV
jgi:MFS family permease